MANPARVSAHAVIWSHAGGSGCLAAPARLFTVISCVIVILPGPPVPATTPYWLPAAPQAINSAGGAASSRDLAERPRGAGFRRSRADARGRPE
ncbi:hypothetical protein GCM10010187_00960 [Actinomadura coerulea]|nr:hypothetical protein GCM10010187_00960 [Actinomadura coerulea]